LGIEETSFFFSFTPPEDFFLVAGWEEVVEGDPSRLTMMRKLIKKRKGRTEGRR